MDELAAAAAVVSISMDDNGQEDVELEDAPGAVRAVRQRRPALEDTFTDKENAGGLPVVQEQRAANPRV